MPFDLFGEIPVTHDDIYAWVNAVAPRWIYPPRSFNNYVRMWDVVGKIKAAKLRGTFDDIIKKPSDVYHARLSLDSIL